MKLAAFLQNRVAGWMKRPYQPPATDAASEADNPSAEQPLQPPSDLAEAATPWLLEISHDELGVIVDALAGPLRPQIAVALGSTCKSLRTPLRPTLDLLEQWHPRAAALCRKVSKGRRSCADLPDNHDILTWTTTSLSAGDMATFGMLLGTGRLPRLRVLSLGNNFLGDAGMQSLCEGLRQGATPRLHHLELYHNSFGPVGAEALAAAIGRGALPKLNQLTLYNNPLGDRGVAALAASLKEVPSLQQLALGECDISDEGVASLVAGIGNTHLGALQTLQLQRNVLTEESCATLVTALDAGAMPKVDAVHLHFNPMNNRALQTVVGAVMRSKARRLA